MYDKNSKIICKQVGTVVRATDEKPTMPVRTWKYLEYAYNS